MQLLLLLMVLPVVGGCPWVRELREQALPSSGMAEAQCRAISQKQGWKTAQTLLTFDGRNEILVEPSTSVISPQALLNFRHL